VAAAAVAAAPIRATGRGGGRPARSPDRLTYKERRELEALPGLIETLEREQKELEGELSQADFYKEPRERIEQVLARVTAVGAEIETAYERWHALESRVPERAG
jgi:ATP-binding cassette subfamily F protein uup